jgi:LacI family transcriptional regulator
MSKQRVLVELGLPYHQHTREYIWGIYDYAQRNADGWEFVTDPFDFYETFRPGMLPVEKVDAAFVATRLPGPRLAELRQAGKPIVNLAHPEENLGVPCVTADDIQVGRYAAEHLDQPAVQQTLFVGPEFRRSLVRLEGFRAELLRRGRPEPEVLFESEDMRSGSAARRQKHLGSLLRRLTHGQSGRLGVFAFSDSFGHAVLKCAEQLGLTIPEQIAVIGTDNDPLICSLGRVPLTSIGMNFRKTGYVAAELLHALLRGESVAPVTLIDPQRPVERLSSSHLAVNDPLIAKALTVIQEQALNGLRVKELMAYLPISRRTLEIRFRSVVGRSLHEEIERIRIEKALSLLEEDKWPNSRIAQACGFSSATRFEQAFRQAMGKRPSQIRNRKVEVKSAHGAKAVTPPKRRPSR